MRKIFATIGIAAALHCVSSLSAQPQPPQDPLQDMFIPPELIMQYQQELGLSEEQKDALHSRLEKLKPDFEKRQQALQQQIQAMQQLLQEQELDESKASKQFEQILTRENEMKKLQFGLMIGIRGILSSEQRAKALKLKQDWPQARRQMEERLRAKMEKIHAGVQKLVDSGTEPSEVGTLMQQFQPLIDAGKVKDAEAILDQAISLIDEKSKK
jgi:Spy/CpxP family protein refolding chaperone